MVMSRTVLIGGGGVANRDTRRVMMVMLVGGDRARDVGGGMDLPGGRGRRQPERDEQAGGYSQKMSQRIAHRG